MIHWVINMIAFVMVIYLFVALWYSDRVSRELYAHVKRSDSERERAESDAWTARRALCAERNEHAETLTQVRLLRDRLETLDPDTTRPLQSDRAEALRKLQEVA